MTLKILIRTLFLLTAIAATSLCRQDPSVREADRVRLAEAFRFSSTSAERAGVLCEHADGGSERLP